MLVRIVKDWNYPECFFGQTPKGDGTWEGITFTEEPVAECDYLIVLQRPPYTVKTKCPSGNAWLITQEPPTNYFRFYTRSFKYFDRVYSYYKDVRHTNIRSMQPVLPWHVFKNYNELTALTKESLGEKKDEVVWITSNKEGFTGQKVRMQFKKFLQESDFNFHLFGRGFTPLHDKFDGLFPYKYALAIENYSCENYWTEKIADSFLSWCLPFYWGAANLEDFFPSDSFIRIDIYKPEEAMNRIREAIQNNEWEKRLKAIEQARHAVLNKYQFFPYVANMIKDDTRTATKPLIKEYLIPANPYPWTYKAMNHLKYYWKRSTDWSPVSSWNRKR